MGNVIYGNRLSCYETVEACSQACARFECVFVDKCNGGSTAHYVCLPFDTRLFMWLLVGMFLLVVLSCSAIVVCYAMRAIRASFRHALVTENDIIFCNSANVHTFPHPALYNNGGAFYGGGAGGTTNPHYTPNSNANYGTPPAVGSISSFSGYGVVPYPSVAQQKEKDKNKTFY